MSKSTGLGMALYLTGYDISGDTQALSKISGSIKTLDVTGIDKSAFERLGGQADGEIAMTNYFNKTGAHVPLSSLPRTDIQLMCSIGTSIGSPAAMMVGKQIDYAPNRASDGSLIMSTSAQANGYGLEWGLLLTAGKRTDTAATNGASFDGANGLATPAVPASTVAVVNPAPMPVSVVITGGTMTNVSINGVTVGTGAGTYTLPQGASITLTYTVAPTWTWTATSAYGAQAYLQVFAFTGTDATVVLQDSADNSAWANIASGSFTQITSGTPQAQRIALSNTATVRRYLRAITTTSGGFTTLTFAVAIDRNLSAGVSF